MPSSPYYILGRFSVHYPSAASSTPRNFEKKDLSYEEWKSVLHLSTRWGFDSIRELALSSIEPPTIHDRLLLARTYSVDRWVVPALSALCERTTPLTLSEARQLSIEDVVLVSTVREDIRNPTLQVDIAEIPLRVNLEIERLGAETAVGLEIPFRLYIPKMEVPPPVDLKRAAQDHESDGERSVEEEVSVNVGALIGEPAQFMENSQGEAAAINRIETGGATWLMAHHMGSQQGDLEGDDNGVAITASAPKPKPPVSPVNEKIEGAAPVTVGLRPAASESHVVPSYPVGRGISLPFSQLLPRCARCNCHALIAMTHRSDPGKDRVLCLDHGLLWTSDTEDLVLLKAWNQYSFISPVHETAIRAFLARGKLKVIRQWDRGKWASF